MASNLEKGIIELLENAVNDKIDNFEVKIHGGNEKGEGFLGEMMFISLKNKHSGEVLNLVVKEVLRSETEKTKSIMSGSYFNEIHYYTKIFPALLEFQKMYPEIKTFDNFPKCYSTCSEEGFEKLVLENLKTCNYEIHPKSIPIDLKMFEAIFKMYGAYHALGFAYKQHQPENFVELTKDLSNNWLKFSETEEMSEEIKHFVGKIIQYLKEYHEDKLVEKIQKYHEDPIKIYIETVTYTGSHGTILHGDCWSNNMMFKYNSSRDIAHIKMIDFQIGSVGSPVSDLCYSFYSGAGEEALDNLDHLLKVYHNTLSEFLKKYGCDPEKIYPYKQLREDWKKYCPFGFIMGIILWVTKLAYDMSEMPSINEIMDKKSEMSSKENDYGIKYHIEEYKKLTYDLIKHMDKNDFL